VADPQAGDRFTLAHRRGAGAGAGQLRVPAHRLLGAAHRQPGSLLAQWPEGAVVTWALAMVVGSSTALIGYWTYPTHDLVHG
jgi:hypothetical protein